MYKKHNFHINETGEDKLIINHCALYLLLIDLNAPVSCLHLDIETNSSQMADLVAQVPDGANNSDNRVLTNMNSVMK